MRSKQILKQIKDFFTALELWHKVVAGLIVAVILFFLAWLNPTCQEETKSNLPPANEGIGINIEHIESGATLVINYVDGLPESPIPEVRNLFQKGQDHFEKGDFLKAIDSFKSCLILEKDHEKLGALNLQIGNCYAELHRYIKAAEFYALGLRESRQANDQQGQASIFVGIANTYLMRPSSTGTDRGDNVRQAVYNYENALKIFIKDEYPLQYATTQNNLGLAYIALPATTLEERTKNIINAIKCYEDVLDIRKKDEYPNRHALTQNRLGLTYTYLAAATPEQRAQNILNAIECYETALQIYKKDKYPGGYAMTQNNIGNAYMDSPALTSEQRVQNITKAIKCYKAALEIRKKDANPLQYAVYQNNLGTAYRVSPAPNAEEKEQNHRNATECFKVALEIIKKDEYPHYYCLVAFNMGLILLDIEDKDALFWLKEAYTLRQFLPDQGKILETAMSRISDG